MNSSAYWNGQLNYYMTNKPASPTSFYNKDFVDKMNWARQDIDKLVPKRDRAWSATAQAQDDYKTFSGTMTTYEEGYNKAAAEFGIEQHGEQYEKNKEAIALAESTLSALPSKINAASNTVLTQKQFEARYNRQADSINAWQNKLLTNQSGYEQVWKKARESQAAYAQAEMATQYSKLQDFNNAYVLAANEFLAAQDKINKNTEELTAWSDQYRSWQQMQYQNEYTVWCNNLNNALERYKASLNEEMAVDAAIRKAERNSQLAGVIVNNYIQNNLNEQKIASIRAGGDIGGAAYLFNR